MAVANLHIWNKYIRYNFLIVFILIIDHENMYRHHFCGSIMHAFNNIE